MQPVNRARKSQGSAAQIGDARPHGIIDTFDGGGFSELAGPGVGAAFEAAAMLERIVFKESGIGIEAIGENKVAFPGRWHLLPEFSRTVSIARPDMQSHDLQVVARERQPNPHLLRLGEDKAPHLIQNHFIVVGMRGQSFLQRRQLIDFF